MQYVEIKQQEDFDELVQSRPGKRNALCHEMIIEILDVQRTLRASSSRALLLSSTGSVFSAGHDFSEMAGASISTMQSLFRDCAQMMLGFQSLGAPVLAAVQGPAIGAGCQLALAADLLVAASSASFQTPGGRGAWFCTTPMLEVIRNLPSKLAMEMLLTGEPIDAKQAKSWAIVSRVVEDGELRAESEALLRLATRGSTTSKACGKRAFYAVSSMTHEAAYAYGTEVMAAAGADAEAQRAMDDIVHKRRRSL